MAGSEELIPLRFANLSDGDNISDLSGDEEVEQFSRVKFYTIDEALNKIGFGRYQLRMLFILGFLSVSDALEVMLLSVLSPALRCDWNLNSAQIAFVSTAIFGGMLLGAGLWGKMSDVYGRWVVLLMSMFTLMYFGLMTSISPSYYWLIFLRFFVGFATTGTAQGFILFAEMIPPAHRGKLLTLSGVFWATGNVAEAVVASIIIPTLGWRYMVAFTACLALVSMMFFKFVPESPRYYLAHGRRVEAEAVLQEMAKDNGTTLPKGHLASNRSGNTKLEAPGQFKDLFSPTYRRTTLQLWGTWFVMAFGYYGVVLSASELLERGRVCDSDSATKLAAELSLKTLEECGCRMFSADDYKTLMFSSLGEYANIIFNLVMLDWIGRKYTLSLSLIGCAITMLGLTGCNTRLATSLLMFGARGFIAAVGAATYVYTSEVYPTTFRALGLGVCSSIARFGSMSSPYISQVLMDFSAEAALSLYAVVFVLCAINTALLPIETKGRHLKESN